MKLRSKPYFPTVGWLEDFPQRHGLDGGRLLAMRQHIEARLPHIRSVAVARHGYVLFEMYRQGFGRDSLLDLASVTKTVTALAFGIAIGQGILRLDERIVERYPGLVASADARAEQLAVEHLLAMTAGFDWSDAHVRSWRLAEDQPRFPLRHAFKDTPGVVFNYDTPASHLLAGVLHQACGQTLLEFCDTHLFGPLGITQRSWQQDAEGYSYAGHGLSLNTRDTLKLGLLCLRGGIWDGRRVLPEGWVARMTMAHSPGYPDTFGAYGYLCWIQPVREHASYYAAGSGGQYLHMIPDLDLLVLVTSNHDRLHAENKQLVRDFVVPAVLDSTMEPQCDGA